MRIVIIGAGVVGLHLASRLSGEGHDLFLVDKRHNRLRSAEEQMDVKTIVGDATSISVLRNASADECDLLIAVTDSDTTNVLICQIASRMGARKRIARLRESECFQDPTVLIPGDVGIDMVIFPEQEAAREILNLLSHPYASDISSFFADKMEMVGLDLPQGTILSGLDLEGLETLSKRPFRLVGIARGSETIVPVNWKDRLRVKDRIFITAKSEDMNRLIRDFGYKENLPRKIFLFGGSIIGFTVARQLEGSHLEVRVLEPNRERSKEMAYDLKHAMILHGDATDTALLEGEGISECDVFIAVTDNEEVNMTSCMLAKRLGAKKCIAAVTKPDYVSLVSELGIDGIVSQRMTTINRIMHFVRRGEVISVAELREGKIEAIEFRVTKNSVLDGMEIGSEAFRQVFPSNAIIGGVSTAKGEVAVPVSKMMLSENDRVMVYSNAETVLELEKLFV